MKLNDKQQLLVLIAVFALVVLGEGLYAYSCLQERSELKDQLARFDIEEKAAEEKIKQIPILKSKAKELVQIIDEYSNILPTEREASNEAFIEDIEGFTRGTGLHLINGAPLESRAKGGKKDVARDSYEQRKYKFQLDGTFSGFVKFINKIENHVRYLEVLDISINPTGGEGPAGSNELSLDPRKALEVVVSTYTYKKTQPKADPKAAAKK